MRLVLIAALALACGSEAQTEPLAGSCSGPSASFEDMCGALADAIAARCPASSLSCLDPGTCAPGRFREDQIETCTISVREAPSCEEAWSALEVCEIDCAAEE